MSGPIRSTEVRRVQTPNATMTTLASPSLGFSQTLSLWRVEMQAGQQGPLHVFDSEQVWTAQRGQVAIEVDGATAELDAGDTLVIAAESMRQVTARTDVELLVCGRGDAVASVPGEPTSRGTPPWIQ